MSERSISKQQYMVALGLTNLGHMYVRKMNDIERELANAIGEPKSSIGEYGHVSDLLYSPETTLDDTLERMDIIVEDKNE